jgi:MYXO-CTERM domain-containing protein
VLLVAGSPTYDEATSTGLKNGTVEVVPGWGVNNNGSAVGYSQKYVGGTPKFADKFDLFAFDGAWGGGTGAAIISAGSTGWDVSRASTVRDGAKVYITGIAGLPGDTNDDGVVDAADYITVKQNFGMTDADWSQGNFTVGDGTVDWADLQILMAHFGTRSVGGAPAAPEPAALGLLALGAAALLRRRRQVANAS